MTTVTERRPLMDLPTVAEYLGVGERHIRRLVQERRAPSQSRRTAPASRRTPPDPMLHAAPQTGPRRAPGQSGDLL
jgi:hypothetical protein